MFNHYIYDSESYCERCLPKVTGESLKLSLEIAQENEGEQDTPANCSRCGRPLKYSLTTDGVDYVLEKIQDILDEGPRRWNRVYKSPRKPDYYKGCRSCDVVRDWAEDLREYYLTDQQKQLVDRFLALTAKGADVKALRKEFADEDKQDAETPR